MPHTKKTTEKELEIELPETLSADKIEDAEAIVGDAEEAEELADDAELDREELNPFGDKWEE